MSDAHELEVTRIRSEYERRAREIPADFYALTRPANLFFRQSQDRALLWALRRAGALPLSGKRVIDVGAGGGQWLASFEAFGAERARLAAVDLDASRAEACRARFAGADVRVGDAAHLAWPDGHFDVVFQSTLFTSILDAQARAAVAKEMLRVLRPRGAVVWYDFAYDNPRNPNVRGVPLRALRTLFPDSTVEARRVTLAPPIARRLAPASWVAAAALEGLRLLNTHLVAVVKRRGHTEEAGLGR